MMTPPKKSRVLYKSTFFASILVCLCIHIPYCNKKILWMHAQFPGTKRFHLFHCLQTPTYTILASHRTNNSDVFTILQKCFSWHFCFQSIVFRIHNNVLCHVTKFQHTHVASTHTYCIFHLWHSPSFSCSCINLQKIWQYERRVWRNKQSCTFPVFFTFFPCFIKKKKCTTIKITKKSETKRVARTLMQG